MTVDEHLGGRSDKTGDRLAGGLGAVGMGNKRGEGLVPGPCLCGVQGPAVRPRVTQPCVPYPTSLQDRQ